MSTLTYAARDSTTMLRRNLRRMLRYPSMTLMLVGIPVILMLLFVYVFGGTMGAGLGGISGGRAEYANYITPGILLITVGGAAQGTAISVAMDMTEGIIARFRTMAIFRPSVLTGHVLGSMIQTMLSLAVVLGIALLVGFRPTANPVEWLATVGILAAITFAEQHRPRGLFADEVLQAGQHLAHDTPVTLASGSAPANETPAVFVVEAGCGYAPGWESHRGRRRRRVRANGRERAGGKRHPARHHPARHAQSFCQGSRDTARRGARGGDHRGW